MGRNRANSLYSRYNRESVIKLIVVAVEASYSSYTYYLYIRIQLGNTYTMDTYKRSFIYRVIVVKQRYKVISFKPFRNIDTKFLLP